jgi:hypothetical protein
MDEYGSARIAMPDGSRERDKWVYALIRCPVLAENVVALLKGVRLNTAQALAGVIAVESSDAGLNAPQPPPKPGGVPVWPLLIGEIERGNVGRHAALIAQDMRERDAAGRAKYGMPLTADNGRDHLVDAYQEALDCAVYLRALLDTTCLPDSPAAVERLMCHALALVHGLRDALFVRDGR